MPEHSAVGHIQMGAYPEEVEKNEFVVFARSKKKPLHRVCMKQRQWEIQESLIYFMFIHTRR